MKCHSQGVNYIFDFFFFKTNSNDCSLVQRGLYLSHHPSIPNDHILKFTLSLHITSSIMSFFFLVCTEFPASLRFYTFLNLDSDFYSVSGNLSSSKGCLGLDYYFQIFEKVAFSAVH